jgi:putative ABC transport system ATP-binding protein
MPAIDLHNIHKAYRQGQATIKALSGVSLTVESGEFMAVVGRSGSGKTTLLDVAGLLLRPTSGSVLIDGVDAASLPDRHRAAIRATRIGFVFQEYNLLPALSVLDNVLLPRRYGGGNRASARARARELLDLVGLGNRIRHRPDELSGGQQQRVAIARALVNRPALVLADEPTGAVDSETSTQLVGLMRRLNAEDGTAFVIVTHDLELAGQTDRIVRLRDGEIAADERRLSTDTEAA